MRALTTNREDPVISKTADKTAVTAQFASDVQYYLSLTPRQLPSRYFYDELGSALFDAICRLPWYGVTRAERRLLAHHGRQILARVHDLTTIIELGPGNGEKLGALVEARVGKGRWVYVGLGLWRQLPAGTDGAYQLLANLLALPKAR